MTYSQFATGFTTGMNTTGFYFDWLVGSIDTTVDFLYNNLLINPIFQAFIVVMLVLSILPFRE